MTVAAEDWEKTLGVNIQVGEVNCVVEKQRGTKVVRCYECQQFGHISAHCTAGSCCVVCAGDHPSDYNCKFPVKCRNCEGTHPASDSSCPAYRQHHADLPK